MNRTTLDNLIATWSSLGAGFAAEPLDAHDLDLERLLLDTTRHIPTMARLFTMAATWLHIYGDTIAKHRLIRLIDDELEPEYRPVLGLLLDTAQQGTHPRAFESITKQLSPEASPKPLFESSRENGTLAEIAQRRASSLSRKWGLWAQPVELKRDAIRPPLDDGAPPRAAHTRGFPRRPARVDSGSIAARPQCRRERVAPRGCRGRLTLSGQKRD